MTVEGDVSSVNPEPLWVHATGMMHFYKMPMGLTVTFVEGTQQVGRTRKYTDPNRIYDIPRPSLPRLGQPPDRVAPTP
jgi:hypothetical protein